MRTGVSCSCTRALRAANQSRHFARLTEMRLASSERCSDTLRNLETYAQDAQMLKRATEGSIAKEMERVEHQRQVFEPNQRAFARHYSGGKANAEAPRMGIDAHQFQATYLITLPRPPSIVHEPLTQECLKSFDSLLYPPCPLMHRYASFGSDSQSVNEVLGEVARLLCTHDADTEQLRLTIMVFFRTFIPLLPSSGANNQVLTLDSFDILLGYAWSSLFSQHSDGSSCQQHMGAWYSIKRAIRRGLGLAVSGNELPHELIVRKLVFKFVHTAIHKESGSIYVARRDNRSVVAELFAALARRSEPQTANDNVFRALHDEVVVGLYIVPFVVSAAGSAVELCELCAELMRMFERSETPVKAESLTQIRVGIHRCVAQRPGMFSPISKEPHACAQVRLNLAGHSNDEPGLIHDIFKPDLFTMTGIAIRVAVFHYLLPASREYCLFIEDLKEKNNESASHGPSDWDSIDVSSRTKTGDRLAPSSERVSDFDAFALSQFIFKEHALVLSRITGVVSDESSSLVNAITEAFIKRQPSEPISTKALCSLLTSDTSTAIGSLLNAGGIFPAVNSLSLEDVRVVMLRWLLCGIAPEYVCDSKVTCGVFTRNTISQAQPPRLPALARMRDAVLAETTSSISLCAPSIDFSAAGSSKHEANIGDLHQEQLSTGASRKIPEYIEESDVLELDAADFEEEAAQGSRKTVFTDGERLKAESKPVPHSVRRMIEYNASLGDTEVAERVRITLRKALWKGSGATLAHALPLSVLAKAILWNSYARTSTRNLRKFLSYFPEHFELFIVGEKDVWVRTAPNAPSGGPLVPPLPSEKPVIPHGTNHPRASPPPPSAGMKQGDLSVFARLVSMLRPLIHVQILSALSARPESALLNCGVFDGMPVNLYSGIGEEDRASNRNALGFSILKLCELTEANPKRLRNALASMPSSMATLMPTLSVVPNSAGGEDLTVLEQRDENAILVLGQHLYDLEYIRFLLSPSAVIDSALKLGLPLWRSVHQIDDVNAAPDSSVNWRTMCVRPKIFEGLTEERILDFVPRFLFEKILCPLFSNRFDTPSYAPMMRFVAQTLPEQTKRIPLLPAMEAEPIAFIDARSIELLIGWRDNGLHRYQTGSMQQSSLEKRLQLGPLNALVDKFAANPTRLEEITQPSSRPLSPKRSLFTSRSEGGALTITIVEQRLPGGNHDETTISLHRTCHSKTSPVDIAMAELFRKRVDKRLSSLPNIPLSSVISAIREGPLDSSKNDKMSTSAAVTMHNQPHAGLPRFASISDAVAPPPPLKAPRPPHTNPLAPPPIPTVVGSVSSNYYYGGVLTFSQLLTEAKRKCIPQRRYFDPLIQFIADTVFAIFDVVLPALDVQNSGGSNRMERFALVSGYSNKCQHKVGTIESFVSYWDGLFVEVMGFPVGHQMENRGEGFVREYKGRVTRRMLYTRFFRPLLAGVTSPVELKDVPPAKANGTPSISNNVGRVTMPVPPSQQGISVDEICAACQYEYLFQARFGSLSTLLLDFGEFRLCPIVEQNLSKGECFVSPQASTAMQHMDYRALFINPVTESVFNAASTPAELEASQTLLSFVDELAGVCPKPPLSTFTMPIEVLVRHIGRSPISRLRTLFESCVTLLPSSRRVLGTYLEALDREKQVPQPSFPMIRQFIESIVALLPLHIQLVFNAGSPVAACVTRTPCSLPQAWKDAYRCNIQPVLASAAWLAMKPSNNNRAMIKLSSLEQLVSWRHVCPKPFPPLPLWKSPVNANASVPLFPLLHLTSRATLSDSDFIEVENVRLAENRDGTECLLDVSPTLAGESLAMASSRLPPLKTFPKRTVYFQADVPHIHSEPCTLRRACFGGEQLTLIANGFDPNSVRVFRVMYASLLGGSREITLRQAEEVLTCISLRDLMRLDEGGPLVSMSSARPSKDKYSESSTHEGALASECLPESRQCPSRASNDMARVDAFLRRQQWYAERNCVELSEKTRRRVLFGNDLVYEENSKLLSGGENGPLEDFESALAAQEALATGQIHGRTTPGTVVMSGCEEGASPFSLVKAQEVAATGVLTDSVLESVVGLTIPLLEQLLTAIPVAPVSLAEVSRVIGMPTEALYWTLCAIQRLQLPLARRGVSAATKLEVQVTFDGTDALVWVSS